MTQHTERFATYADLPAHRDPESLGDLCDDCGELHVPVRPQRTEPPHGTGAVLVSEAAAHLVEDLPPYV